SPSPTPAPAPAHATRTVHDLARFAHWHALADTYMPHPQTHTHTHTHTHTYTQRDWNTYLRDFEALLRQVRLAPGEALTEPRGRRIERVLGGRMRESAGGLGGSHGRLSGFGARGWSCWMSNSSPQTHIHPIHVEESAQSASASRSVPAGDHTNLNVAHDHTMDTGVQNTTSLNGSGGPDTVIHATNVTSTNGVVTPEATNAAHLAGNGITIVFIGLSGSTEHDVVAGPSPLGLSPDVLERVVAAIVAILRSREQLQGAGVVRQSLPGAGAQDAPSGDAQHTRPTEIEVSPSITAGQLEEETATVVGSPGLRVKSQEGEHMDSGVGVGRSSDEVPHSLPPTGAVFPATHASSYIPSHDAGHYASPGDFDSDSAWPGGHDADPFNDPVEAVNRGNAPTDAIPTSTNEGDTPTPDLDFDHDAMLVDEQPPSDTAYTPNRSTAALDTSLFAIHQEIEHFESHCAVRGVVTSRDMCNALAYRLSDAGLIKRVTMTPAFIRGDWIKLKRALLDGFAEEQCSTRTASPISSPSRRTLSSASTYSDEDRDTSPPHRYCYPPPPLHCDSYTQRAPSPEIALLTVRDLVRYINWHAHVNGYTVHDWSTYIHDFQTLLQHVRVEPGEALTEYRVRGFFWLGICTPLRARIERVLEARTGGGFPWPVARVWQVGLELLKSDMRQEENELWAGDALGAGSATRAPFSRKKIEKRHFTVTLLTIHLDFFFHWTLQDTYSIDADVGRYISVDGHS
ncbi:hypothetical protein EVG20_g11050, partial [Dentipellis fragilis]